MKLSPVAPVASVMNFMNFQAACCFSGVDANISAAAPPVGRRPLSAGTGNEAIRRYHEDPVINRGTDVACGTDRESTFKERLRQAYNILAESVFGSTHFAFNLSSALTKKSGTRSFAVLSVALLRACNF